MGIRKRDLVLTGVGVGVIVVITLAVTVVTLWGAAGAIPFLP